MPPARDDEALLKSVQSFIEEKRAVAARERELVDTLNRALTRIGYQVVPMGAGGAADRRGRRRGPGRPPGSGRAGTRRRRRGRPAKSAATAQRKARGGKSRRRPGRPRKAEPKE